MNRVHTLSAEEIQALKQLHREADDADVRNRCDMILWSNEGLSLPRIAERVRFSRDTVVRWLSLPLGVVLAAAQVPLLGLEEAPAFGTWRYALGWGSRALASWCCILAILGFGRKRLNFSTPFLRYANEAVLPFYILHQTVLLGVGYFVLQWAIPDLLKWAIILPASFVLIMVVYEFLVRRYNVMRFLFGMKPRPKAPTAQPKEAVGTLPSA